MLLYVACTTISLQNFDGNSSNLHFFLAHFQRVDLTFVTSTSSAFNTAMFGMLQHVPTKLAWFTLSNLLSRTP